MASIAYRKYKNAVRMSNICNIILLVLAFIIVCFFQLPMVCQKGHYGLLELID